MYVGFLRPREDGNGFGGSPYWIIDMAEKVALIGALVTGMLIWVTGQWDRGVRWPRRWIGVANRGLRIINCKVIILNDSCWRELLFHTANIASSFINFPGPSTEKLHSAPIRNIENRDNYPLLESRRVNYTLRRLIVDDDITPGGDHVMVLLLPKYFSPSFRENWELYRSEYWVIENARRATLRRIIRKDNEDRQGARPWINWRSWVQ